jgi:hypothetical protein
MAAISNGGMTHARYAHNCRPRDLELQCPRCGALAIAKKPSEAREPLLIGDLSPGWSLPDWCLTCSACLYRKEGLAFDDLPQPYWHVEVGDIGVWSWNRDHMVFIAEYLDGKASPNHPYAWFGSYIPGTWKRRAADVSRAIIARLNVTA